MTTLPPEPRADLEAKREVLRARLQAAGRLLIAFSGGVDSSYLAFAAHRVLGDAALAVTADSPSYPTSHRDMAVRVAADFGIPHRFVNTSEMDNADYLANPENRCFHCKSELFSELEEVRERVGFAMILGGENKDDHSDYRPGLVAAANFHVRGPLAECGVNKDELRAIAKHYDLKCWEKPASPCLSSRIPYFNEITPDKLRQIEAGEALLEGRGFPVSRVRHHGSFARLEVPPEKLIRLRDQETEIAAEFRNLGFENIEIDPEGFVSGKLNRAL